MNVLLDAVPLDAPVHVTTEIDAAAAAALLSELPQERCAHSWRKLLPTSGTIGTRDVERVIAHEQRQRPTTFFWFWRGGELAAVATVAERISASFAVAGFPVLARSYVRPQMRGRGLYCQLVIHRVAYCREQYGAELRGIHFGTNDPRVVRTASEHLAPAPLCFGEEALAMPEGASTVRCYLAPSPHFAAQLRAELAPLEVHPDPIARGFSLAAHRFVLRGYDPEAHDSASARRLASALREIDVHVPAWRELFAFCSSISLVK